MQESNLREANEGSDRDQGSHHVKSSPCEVASSPCEVAVIVRSRLVTITCCFCALRLLASLSHCVIFVVKITWSHSLCRPHRPSLICVLHLKELSVIDVGVKTAQIPLWNQKASKRADGMILWDYHVICIQIKQGNVPSLVWDLDSTLPFPSPLPLYAYETIQPSFQLFF
ncbi:Protein N-terminal glutamine amidohydrolase [Vigna unguiculata]|uniref:Protein N-terminal glutamine amidohydrolase n=1 Tax=Vigna unguiculata TaxID=3917 RepID=A0A4D6LDV7_VIGUN|nr:Protein N-terminal glutamine amidohydrolase [Vigna unguiculata]